jgi:glycosyltransferase involved in cell wall biosynthesis
VAHYASMVLPALRKRVDVEAFGSLDGYRAEEFDAAIYQLGNNPHHEFVYREAMRNPGVVVLHDVVLHHLIVEMTLARGDIEGYVEALRAGHGEAGAAWARGRAAGLHSEMGNFLLPASVDLARRSKGVIVHNRWAADWLQSFGVDTPVIVAPHPYEPMPPLPKLRKPHRTIGFFGFLTSAKRGEVVVEALRIARARDPRLELIIVGEAAPNIDLPTTGYVSDEEFVRHFAEVDRLVNLRYPSAGETSGTLIRAFAAGKPVAVSDYAQFAEYPDTCVTKIPFGPDEAEQLAEFFLADLDDEAIARAQRAWLEENADIEKTVDAYLRWQATAIPQRQQAAALLPLFPQVEVTRTRPGVVTFRNIGDTTLRGVDYAQPAYRAIINGRWIALPGDLPPGASVDVEMEGDGELTISHALQSIPNV